MRVVISGTRTITDVKAVENIIRPYIGFKDELVVGDARGVDAIAADFGYRYFADVEKYEADWKKHGKAAGPIRNREMLESDVDQFVAVWDGKSPGTRNAIHTALELGIETHVYFLR